MNSDSFRGGQAEHVNARGECGMRNAECGMDITAEQLMTEDVVDLKEAVTGNDEVAIGIDEGEVVVTFSGIGAEHQLEPSFVVAA